MLYGLKNKFTYEVFLTEEDWQFIDIVCASKSEQEKRIKINSLFLAGLHEKLHELAGESYSDLKNDAEALIEDKRFRHRGILRAEGLDPASLQLFMESCKFMEKSVVETLSQMLRDKAREVFGAQLDLLENNLANQSLAVNVEHPGVSVSVFDEFVP